MSMTLTERAATQIRRQLDKRGSGIALRIGIKKPAPTAAVETHDRQPEQTS